MTEGPKTPRVRAIGGVFFRARDPKALGAWYREKLGFAVESWGGCSFPWREAEGEGSGYTVWSPFAEDTEYFAPSDKPYMLNLRVDDLAAMLAHLREQGCNVLDRGEESEFGKFGYVVDPEGTLLELWQQADEQPEPAEANSDQSGPA